MIKVKFDSFDCDAAVLVWIYREKESGGIDVLEYDPKEEHCQWLGYDEESGYTPERVKPSFQLPRHFGNEIKAAFVKALDEEGVKLPSEEGARGKLAATERHLMDMRELVKTWCRPMAIQRSPTVKTGS